MRVRWLSRSATLERLVCLACVVCVVCLLGFLPGEGVGLAPELPLLEVGLEVEREMTCREIHRACLPTYLPLLICLSTYPPIHLFTYLPICLNLGLQLRVRLHLRLE